MKRFWNTWALCVLVLFGLSLTACGGGDVDDTATTGSGVAPADPGATPRGYVLSSAIWQQTDIPVCWINPEPANATPRLWVREAIERTWQAHSRLTFTGWDLCPQAIAGDAIRIYIRDAQSYSTFGKGAGMQLNLSFVQWGQDYCQRSASILKTCVEFTAVHEFGHALGFSHEHHRHDTPADCQKAPQGIDGDVTVGPWDLYSVMNYCNPNSYLTSALSEIDIRMVQQFYGARSGLSGAYFNNPNLQGTPVLQRTEQVHFNWDSKAPAIDMPADQFSVRWTGFIEAPVTGTYTLRTWSDDGVRVWVDGQLVIDNWTGHAVTVDDSPPLSWSAGRHAIQVEYQELSGLSTIALLWRPPGEAMDHVPLNSLSPAAGRGLSAFYFGNPDLQGTPVWTRLEAVDFQGTEAPQGVPVPADGFSVRWSGLIEAPYSGDYALQTLSDDGIRVWLDGELVIDNWGGHAPTLDTIATRRWEAGQRHVITIDYQELGGPGTAQLRWQTPGATAFTTVPQGQLYPYAGGTGLTGNYFSTPDLVGIPAATRDEAIDFQWPAEPDFPYVPADGFSVIWRGWIEAPASGGYALQTLSDDGIRVWIDGRLVIDNWTGHAPVQDTSAEMTWGAGERHAIAVAYQELGGPGTVQLRWRLPLATTFTVVPLTRLYPGLARYGLNAAYFANPNLQGSPTLHRTEAISYQGDAAPAPGLPADGFSVRWSGFVQADVSGTHVLQTMSDDGIRLWVDGQLVIDNWGAHATQVDTGPAWFWARGERHAITVEYQELGGTGTARLRWLTPSRGEYVDLPLTALSPQ